MKRPLVLALAAAATLFGATAAQAARVDGSIGIGVPPLVDASRPRLIVEPAPYYAPRPRVWLPPLPVWTGNDRWRDGGHEGWHDRREDWRNDRHDGRDGNDRRNGRGHDDGRSHDGRDHDGHLGRVVWR